MQQLGDTMTAQEFGEHYALECEEPVPSATFKVLSQLLAAIANGPLQPPAAGRIWAPHDFMPDLWQDISQEEPATENLSIDEIMARARTVGMVQ